MKPDQSISMRTLRTRLKKHGVPVPLHLSREDLEDKLSGFETEDQGPIESTAEASVSESICSVKVEDINGWWSGIIQADGDYDITFYWPTNLKNRRPGSKSPDDVNLKGADLDRLIETLVHIWNRSDSVLDVGLNAIREAHLNRAANVQHHQEITENPPEPDAGDALIEKCAKILGSGHRNQFGYLEFMASVYAIPITQESNVVRAFHPVKATEGRDIMQLKEDVLKKIRENPTDEIRHVVTGGI